MNRSKLVTLIAVCFLIPASSARATCGSANCFLVTGTQDGVGAKGSFIIDLSYRYVDQTRRLDGTDDVHEVLTPKVDFENEELELDHHREIKTQNTLVQLDLSWAMTDRLTFSGSLPLINQRDHEHFDDAGTPTESFTSEDGTSGFGDVRVGARYAFMIRTKDLLVGGLALKLPTGQYRLLDSEGDINEPTIQPGTGSTDAIANLYYAHQWIPMQLEYFVSGSRKMNGENELDYRMGVENMFNAGVTYSPGKRVGWMLQMNARRTAHDQYKEELVPSTGTTFVNITPGLRVTTTASTSFYAFAQVPVYQKVNDTQLAPRTGLLVGISRIF